MLLGDSFHPGGVRLTQRIGELLGLSPAAHVLDVAAGPGTSALHLAKIFGCRVTGIDLSEQNIFAARAGADAQGLSERVHFRLADAERLPFPDATFDAIVCECAFCTFPGKDSAAAEFARVLKVGGGVGIGDLTRTEAPLPEMEGLLAWIACIGDALPVQEYASILKHAGLSVEKTEMHEDALSEMVRNVQSRLLGVEIASGLGKLHIPGLDLEAAKQFASAAAEAICGGKLGYAILVARRHA
jgi:ubiquinone/menaquinone biosynthesis C-methylase UbiE